MAKARQKRATVQSGASAKAFEGPELDGSTPIGKLVFALNAKPNGNKGWQALCPAHNDHNPSLDIDVGKDGKLLVICRAGCSQEAVITALKARSVWPGNGFDEKEANRIGAALSLYGASKERLPAPALKYLKRRGLKTTDFPALRWCRMNSALIFPTGSTGVQQIYLTKDGEKNDKDGRKAKISNGPMGPGWVMKRDGAVITFVTEGPEDGMACFEAMPKAAVIAACSQSQLRKAVAAAETEQVVLVLDADTKIKMIGSALARVPHLQIVRMPAGRKDINAVLTEDGIQAVRRVLKVTEEPSDEELAAAKGAGEDAGAAVEELNEKHFVVRLGGKVAVASPIIDAVTRKPRMDYIGVEGLRIMYANRRVTVGDRSVALGTYWLNHPDRRQFLGGVTLDPSGGPVADDVYNLWQGFAVEPVEGSWSLMREHIFQVVCGGDRKLFAYVMGWLARMVQKPGKPGEVVLVLRGGRGTGKGVFARAIVRLLGCHGKHITNAEHLVGKHNQHLEDCIVLFADEAFFAGDRKHESVLKGLVTEPTIMVEPKFIGAYLMPNLLHVIMASNDEWVVPAGVDERRFAVLDVTAARRNDFKYFAAIEAELASGGLEAMLHDLLAYDLKAFNVRAVPQTTALIEQKLETLRGADAWLHDVLDRGQIDGPDMLKRTAPTLLFKSSVFADFNHRQKIYRVHSLNHAQFFKSLHAIAEGRIIENHRTNRAGKRHQMVSFAPLNEARKLFEKHIGGRVDWESRGTTLTAPKKEATKK